MISTHVTVIHTSSSLSLSVRMSHNRHMTVQQRAASSGSSSLQMITVISTNYTFLVQRVRVTSRLISKARSSPLVHQERWRFAVCRLDPVGEQMPLVRLEPQILVQVRVRDLLQGLNLVHRYQMTAPPKSRVSITIQIPSLYGHLYPPHTVSFACVTTVIDVKTVLVEQQTTRIHHKALLVFTNKNVNAVQR